MRSVSSKWCLFHRRRPPVRHSPEIRLLWFMQVYITRLYMCRGFRICVPLVLQLRKNYIRRDGNHNYIYILYTYIIRIIHVRARVVFQFISPRGIIRIFVTIGCETLLLRIYIYRYALYLYTGDRVPILHKHTCYPWFKHPSSWWLIMSDGI